MKKVILAAAVTALYLATIKTIYGFYTADLNYVKAQSAIVSGELSKALFYADKSLDQNPSEPRYYLGRAKVYTLFSVGKNGKEYKQKALGDITAALSLNPNNLVTIRNSIPLYFFLAIEDLTKTNAANNTDPQYAEKTEKAIKWMKEKYLHDLGVQVLAAKYEKRLGFESGYEKTVENIKALRPELLNWHSIFN